MSDLEGAVQPFVRAMIKDLAVTLNFEQQKRTALWAMKTSMVLEATIRQRNYAPAYTRAHCEQLRLESKIPERTLMWLGRMSEDNGLFASGTHIWLKNNLLGACDCQVSTFIVGL